MRQLLSKLGRQERIILAIFLVLSWLMVRHYVAEKDSLFFQASVSGIRGLLLYELGDYAGAATAYRQHFRNEDLPKDTSYLSPWNHYHRGELAKAKKEIQKVLDANPENTDALILKGKIALQENNPGQALIWFNKALAIDYNHHEGLLYAALASTRLKKYDHGIESLKISLRNLPKTREGFLVSLQTIGELKALPSSQQPSCLLAYYFRYLRVFDPSQAETAKNYAFQAIAKSDRPDDGYVVLGVMAYFQEEYSEAVRELRKAFELNPQNVEASSWAAKLYAFLGDTPNEYRMRRVAFSLKPNDPYHVLTFLDMIEEKLGDYPEALSITKTLVTQSPNNPEHHVRLGRLYTYLEDFARALREYQTALALDPHNPRYQDSVAYTFHVMGETDKAIKAYHASIDMNPRSAYPHAGLGKIYLNMTYDDRDSLEKARREYETAIQLGNREIDTRMDLCTIYNLQLQHQRARDCYKKVLQLYPNHPIALEQYDIQTRYLESPKPQP